MKANEDANDIQKQHTAFARSASGKRIKVNIVPKQGMN